MRLSINRTKFVSIFICILAFVIYLFVYGELSGSKTVIYILSLLGVVEFVWCYVSLKRVTGKFFSLYGIFLLFAFLFNYGQCLMWAFGIHYRNEIGTANIYTSGIPTGDTIVKTQLLTLMGLLAFHTGALLIMKKPKVDIEEEYINPCIIQVNLKAQALHLACLIAIIVSLPLMYLYQIRDILVNAYYGYGATLYNATVVSSQNNVIELLRQMYFPALVGLLISSGYRKKTVCFCYVSFALYTLLHLMAGNRGEWIFPLFILVWMHHSFVKKMSIKKIIVYSLVGSFIVSVCVGLRNVRDTGISFSALISAMLIDDNPIVSAVFELGGSMRPAILITESGWGIYPYGNTYLLALMGMVTEKFIPFFVPDYVSVSYWFSHYYLKLNFGIGFSLIAEAFINFGPNIAIVFLLFIGMVYSVFISSDHLNVNNNPLKVFLKICALNAMILSVRNYILGSFKQFIFSTLTIYILAILFFSIFKKRKSDEKI